MQPEPQFWLTAHHPLLPANIVAGCTTRAGGVSGGVYASNNLALHVGDDEGLVTTNRESLRTSIGATQIQWLDQVHGNHCAYAQLAESSPLVMKDTDAVWTDEPGLALAVMTADCIPVLIWSIDGSVVGGCHAGWRGLAEGVIGGLVDRLPLPTQQLAAWIGPCISQRHYEVGEDVWRFFAGDEAVGLAPHPDDASKRILDLALIAELQLKALGVSEVRQSGICNYANKNFYSYRQHSRSTTMRGSPDTGRMASVIMISC